MTPDGDRMVVVNQNVLIEIGEAMANLSGRRFILLVKNGVKLPSNLHGHYEVRYEGETLDGDATLRLLKAFNAFRCGNCILRSEIDGSRDATRRAAEGRDKEWFASEEDGTMTAVRPMASIISASTDPEVLLEQDVFRVLQIVERGYDVDEVIEALVADRPLIMRLEIESRVAERTRRLEPCEAPKNLTSALD